MRNSLLYSNSLFGKEISFVDKVLFDIREREGSISRSSFEKLFQDMNIALLSARSFMEEHNCYKSLWTSCIKRDI